MFKKNKDQVNDKNVIMVFEPACDAHWMKDVVQFPNALALELYNKNAILITRPNHKQTEIAKHIKLKLLGGIFKDNYTSFEISNFSTLTTNYSWYLEACKKAADLGCILILYPFYGDAFRGSKYFKLKRWLKFRKAFVIIKSDGSLEKRSTERASVMRRLKDKFNYLFIDKIICENSQVDENMRINNPHLSTKLIYLPNCPLDNYHDQKITPYAHRSNKVLFVGRVHEKQKGSDILLTSWIKIFNKIPEWTLQIVGPCSESFKNEWVRKLEENKASNTVEWISESSPDQLLRYLNNAKILACPSRWDSGPIIMSEAILSGCSFVGNPVGEIPVVLNNLPGLITENETMESQLLFFAKNSDVAKKQNEALYERIKDRKWSDQVKKLSLKPTKC